jgi:hypothetical protein
MVYDVWLSETIGDTKWKSRKEAEDRAIKITAVEETFAIILILNKRGLNSDSKCYVIFSRSLSKMAPIVFTGLTSIPPSFGNDILSWLYGISPLILTVRLSVLPIRKTAFLS